MRNLVKYVGIGLLVMGLAACDDKVMLPTY